MSSSKHSWLQHRKHTHKFVPRSRYFAPDSICKCCLMDFHTMPRLYVHLDKDSPQCLVMLEYACEPLEEAIVQQTEVRRIREAHHARSLGYHARKAFIPPFQCSGPQQLLPSWCDDVRDFEMICRVQLQARARTGNPRN